MNVAGAAGCNSSSSNRRHDIPLQGWGAVRTEAGRAVVWKDLEPARLSADEGWAWSVQTVWQGQVQQQQHVVGQHVAAQERGGVEQQQQHWNRVGM